MAESNTDSLAESNQPTTQSPEAEASNASCQPESKATGEPQERPLSKLPSHSALAMSNYPPLWTKESGVVPRITDPKSEDRKDKPIAASSIKAVLSTKLSESDKKMKTNFRERDPSNRHQHAQQPNRDYTHPRLNIFGRDIGPLGKPPRLNFGLGSKKR